MSEAQRPQMTWPPFVSRDQPLPDAVTKARARFDDANESNRGVLEPLIAIHLLGYDAAIAELRDAHAHVVEQTALDPSAPTREAGTWLIAGRCIGLARASHLAATVWLSVELVPIIRSLHEATRLLGVFRLPGEDKVIDRWLAGRSVSRGEIMAASARQEAVLRHHMLTHGVAPPGETSAYFERQYGQWSEIAHHRRRHMLDQFAPDMRTMITGPHPDWRARAATVDHLGWYITELVSVGGFALAELGRREWADRFQGTYRELLKMKEQIPLDELARKVND
jgi:hypothetical protein